MTTAPPAITPSIMACLLEGCRNVARTWNTLPALRQSLDGRFLTLRLTFQQAEGPKCVENLGRTAGARPPMTTRIGLLVGAGLLALATSTAAIVIPQAAAELKQQTHIRALALDRQNPDHLLIAAHHGLSRSGPAGAGLYGLQPGPIRSERAVCKRPPCRRRQSWLHRFHRQRYHLGSDFARSRRPRRLPPDDG